ncbi:SDR family oxidoreductase [Planctobacterium marinum]|uniref:SDR family oxidoreductase n=1 Tax=Planctobacterium marinum TaxID=1631968 RepID=UPI001E63D32E|nr:SDR family oxidoreductase [Planctobacterium marinum]MCC2604250.1 SDR family oxidoreductase [Planctobacterium marinum]
MIDFNDKVVLVTGATSGIGKTTAKMFASNGAKVVLSGRRTAEGLEVVSEIEKEGGIARFIQCDVSNESQVENLLSGVVQYFGKLDVAFNNAGIGGTIAPLHELSENDWQSTQDINLKGVWLCLKHQIRLFLSQPPKDYTIVNMASLWGTGASDFGASAYTASKHGVIGLTKSAALEYAKNGIRVNAICPAWVPTDANAAVLSNDEMRSHIAAMHPMGRLGTQKEIAECVLWLASESSSFLTGQEILADGGISAKR